MVLGAAGLGGTPASARRRGGVAGARVPPLSPWSRRAARPNTVNVDSAHHLTGRPRECDPPSQSLSIPTPPPGRQPHLLST